ncbi:MAG: hypothetical protein EBR07_01665 [Planctomycetes bacterium]|nr:hypothetical protein [Planctomycetota bacterium]
MNIDHDENGWAFDESENWKLVHNGIDVIFFGNTDKSISTQEQLFVGTEQECREEIARFGRVMAETQPQENQP